MPSLVDLFLACKGFGLFEFLDFGWDFEGSGGLTCDFWAENDERSNGKNHGHSRSLRDDTKKGKGDGTCNCRSFDFEAHEVL